MREILPGVDHWTAVHPNIGSEVSSYWLEGGGVLIDPMIPPDAGLEWFAERSVAPMAIVLSNRHHYRDSARIAERFGVPVYCASSGLHAFTHGEPVSGFEPGDQLPGGMVAFEVGGLCPDETALHMPDQLAVAIADGVVLGSDAEAEGGVRLGFVPDSLMDDPPKTKRALLQAYERMLDELEFEHLLLAHGGPLIGDGRRRLEELVEIGGRTAFEF